MQNVALAVPPRGWLASAGFGRFLPVYGRLRSVHGFGLPKSGSEEGARTLYKTIRNRMTSDMFWLRADRGWFQSLFSVFSGVVLVWSWFQSWFGLRLAFSVGPAARPPVLPRGGLASAGFGRVSTKP